MGHYRVAFDIGGTFTDFVLLDETTGQITLHKLLTTPADPSLASIQGVSEIMTAAGATPADADVAVHGTTLVTNAVIERKGARVGLMTTRGFRDSIEMGREQRYDIYDLFLTFPPPLVPRERRLECSERTSRDGVVLRPLRAAEVQEALAGLRRAGIESLAISFLHSYRNAEHEQQARALVAAQWPELPVSISSEVAPEIREYERTVTTAANAYVQPLVGRYLALLEQSLQARGFAGRFYLMQSNGGICAPDVARSFPVRLLESGPVGGALYAALAGALAGEADLLAFDMGGTTAKACLVQGGQPDLAPVMEAGRVHRFKKGSGLPIKTPVVDMIEIGAGGGSIARVSSLGLLQVGPDSAGADPGPACYDRGGREPTVTDANLLLGYLSPSYFLGGRMHLEPAPAGAAMDRLAAQLGLDRVKTAMGIHAVVNENMAAAARVHIVEKGQDPRRFAVVAFGGAGPAHACRVARLLGAPEVIIPQAAGAASALGFLAAPLAFDLSHSLPGELSRLDWPAVGALLQRLEQEGRHHLAEAGSAGEVTVTRSADMRFLGQVHEISVSLPAGPLGVVNVADLQAAFAREYERLFEHLPPAAEVEVLNWRVRVSGRHPAIRLATAPAGGELSKGERPAYFPEASGFVPTPVFNRYAMPPGFRTTGPAIVEEREATTVVLPGDELSVDEHLQLRIRSVGRAEPNG